MESFLPSCVIHEDEHLLVVNKPAGWNTHAPSPYAIEGIYDWLRQRESRWAKLAIIHRLDKETSGVMVFGKTQLANQSLTTQFAGRTVWKKYLLFTDRKVSRDELTIKSTIARDGERYASLPGGEAAETVFRIVAGNKDHTIMAAEPLTGRTHQVRVHAAENGFPIMGDKLYGGTPHQRVCLHSAELCFNHPATNEPMKFAAPVDFEADARAAIRAAMISQGETDAYCVIHGAADGWPKWHVERLGEFVLSKSDEPLTESQTKQLEIILSGGGRGAYHKLTTRQVQRTATSEKSPRLAMGVAAPERFTVRENGAVYELSFTEGYSVGLFLDQRDNRRRFLTGHVGANFPLFADGAANKTVLNAFAYTCGYSVCAALAGASTTSLDLSKKYLDWGRRNFGLNNLDLSTHYFIYGDTFDWLRRLAKKQREFDVVVLDPPTFSQSKQSGVFRAEKDFGRLVTTSLPLLRKGGVLLASTNAATLRPESFVEMVIDGINRAGRKVIQQLYVPQPPDFPISREEPAHLKTLWLRVG